MPRVNSIDIISLEDSESNDSVIEVEKPPKPVPPLLELTDDNELVLNVAVGVPEIVFHSATTDDIKEVNPLADCISPYHWTPAMRQYYNADWGNETNFTVADLQSKMNKSPRLWEVSPKDLECKSPSGVRCRRCGASGHIKRSCPELKNPKMCHMCGNVGHYVNKCPKTFCLTCGCWKRDFINSCQKCQKQNTVKCIRCSLTGHSIIDCTDNWRRFHNATDGNLGDVARPDGLSLGHVNKPWADLWCCNCGEKGHDAYFCPFPNTSEFPSAFPFVVFYEKNIPQDCLDWSPSKKRNFEGELSNSTKVQNKNSSNKIIPSKALSESPSCEPSIVIFNNCVDDKAPMQKPPVGGRQRNRSGNRYFQIPESTTDSNPTSNSWRKKQKRRKKGKKERDASVVNVKDGNNPNNFFFKRRRRVKDQ